MSITQKQDYLSPSYYTTGQNVLSSSLFDSKSRAKLCRKASVVLPNPPLTSSKRFQFKALLQDHRVMVYRIGQLIDNVNLDHIAGLHIKAGLGYTNLIKISSGRV